MDHAAWLKDGLTEDDAAREPYRQWMRVDPNMREITSKIETIDDEFLGRPMRVRRGRVARIRGEDLDKVPERIIYLDPLPHVQIDKAKDLQGWYQGKDSGEVQGSRVRPCMTDAILTEPYGGWCTVGCTFCYINSGTKGYRGSGLVSVPLDYGAQVEKMLASMKVSAAGYFSSFTDPFLPLEEYYHNTERGATAFVRAGLPIFFLSRLSYPGWAYDLLQRNPHSYAQKSINTPHQADWERLSPGAIPLDQHMAEIRALRALGIYVSIQVNPIVPGITDHDDVRELFEMLAEAGANHVIVKFVEIGHHSKNAMVERITERFTANRAGVFRDLFSQNACGGQRTIAQEYRLQGHHLYRMWATQMGMTYATCYEYAQGEDGSWRSIGPDFLTADQCHGHRVPMYTRGAGGLFEPLGVCPPSGCLSCADTTGLGACGSETLSKAKALTLKDLRSDPGFSRTAG